MGFFESEDFPITAMAFVAAFGIFGNANIVAASLKFR